jgi:hypothetical protein
MAWSNEQKQIAVRACAAGGISDDHRKLILRQFARSMFDRDGRAIPEPSSTSLKLNNSDFERFMAIVEDCGGGQVQVKDSRSGQFLHSRGYWRRKAADDLARMRSLAQKISDTLELERIFERDGKGLLGWIEKRVCKGERKTLDQLDADELYKLIEGLKAFARRHGIKPWRTGATECEDELNLAGRSMR